MKALRFVWVGKLKEPFWREAAAHYWTRLGRFYRLEEHCVKDGSAGTPAQRVQDESARLLGQIKTQDYCVCLDERGAARTSKELAASLERWSEEPRGTPCFVIGGPYGLGRAVLDRAQETLRLSNMTFTHETARVLLLEQLYRGVSILKGLPYHHE